MKEELDKLAKNLARGMSRRQALWAFGSGIGLAAVGLFSARRLEALNTNICVDYCMQFSDPRQYEECIQASSFCPPGQCAAKLNGSSHFCVQVA